MTWFTAAIAALASVWAILWRSSAQRRREEIAVHRRLSDRARRFADVVARRDAAAEAQLEVDLDAIERRINGLSAANTDDIPKLIDKKWQN